MGIYWCCDTKCTSIEDSLSAKIAYLWKINSFIQVIIYGCILSVYQENIIYGSYTEQITAHNHKHWMINHE